MHGLAILEREEWEITERKISLSMVVSAKKPVLTQKTGKKKKEWQV